MTAVQSIGRAYLRGWAVSCLAHGLVVGMALTLFADLKLAPEKEPFRWTVTQVVTPAPEPMPEAQPSEPVARAAPRRPSSLQAPSPEVAEQPPPPVTEVRSVETPATVQTVQAQPVEPIERPAVQPVTREVKQVQAERVVRREEPVQTQEAVAPTSVATQAPAKLQASARAEGAVTKPGPVTAEPATVTREAIAAVAPATPAPPVPPLSRVPPFEGQPTAAPVQEAMVRPTPAEPPAHGEAASEAPAPPREQSAVETVPMRAVPGTKADYGWVADTLRRRVAEVKRYPPTARLNHWEGKVVVHAVIKEDGHLGDLHIHESSGFDVLDEAAMEAVRHACPLSLHHPLGRPRVAIRIPINYTLND